MDQGQLEGERRTAMTAGAMDAAVRSFRRATAQGAKEVEPEHLLIELTGESEAQQALLSAGVDPEALRVDMVGRLATKGSWGAGGPASPSERLCNVFETAALQIEGGLADGRTCVGGAQLLVAIAMEPGCKASEILAEMGAGEMELVAAARLGLADHAQANAQRLAGIRGLMEKRRGKKLADGEPSERRE